MDFFLKLFLPKLYFSIFGIDDALLIAAAASAAGGTAGFLGGKGANKRLPKPVPYQPYSGLRPPRVDTADYASFRPVQKQITETLMRRSQGQDVGFDPNRRNELQNIYDTDFQRLKAQNNRDLGERLSGSGQSRNVAAYNALINRSNQWADDTRSKYIQGIDVEDLAARQSERDVNTQRLQNLNTQNFGQENTAANFDLDVYNAENAAKNQSYNQGMNYAQNYKDPLAEGITGAIGAGISAYTGMNPAPQQYFVQNSDTSPYQQVLKKKASINPKGQYLEA